MKRSFLVTKGSRRGKGNPKREKKGSTEIVKPEMAKKRGRRTFF